MSIPKHVIIENEELGVDWEDEGPWRSFHLDTEGECLANLLDNASVAAVDQDGGDLYNESLYDSNLCVEAAEILIARAFLASRGYKTTRETK